MIVIERRSKWRDFRPSVLSYDGQDLDPTSYAVGDANTTLQLTGNTWKRVQVPIEVSADTVIEFDLQSSVEGEVHAIGFDTDNTLSTSDHFFQLFGTQPWWANQDYHNYDSSQGLRHYLIPIGQYFTGSFTELVLVNDELAMRAYRRIVCSVIYESTTRL